MKFNKIEFSTKTLFGLVLTAWLGIHFNLPLEYWVLAIGANVGITIRRELRK